MVPVPVPGLTGDGGFEYLPAFVSPEEEAHLLSKIDAAPRPKWKQLAHRRLQHWGGQLAERSGVLIPEALPRFFTEYPPLLERIADTGAFAKSRHQKPNHCLVNEYLPGQGIMPHNDGPAYYPAVATLSLGAPILLDVYEHQEGAYPSTPHFSILQEPRSLLITHGVAYTQFVHGIAERTVDTRADLQRVVNHDVLQNPALAQAHELVRARRVSLTFRDVERVAPRLFGN